MSAKVGSVTPGQQAYKVITAKPETVGAQMIESLIDPKEVSANYPLQVIENNLDTTGWVRTRVQVGSEMRVLDLYIGDDCQRPEADVFTIREKPYGISGCMRVNGSEAVVNAERLRLAPERAVSIAREIVVAIVVHGNGWRNSASEVISHPFGHSSSTRKVKKRPRPTRDLSEQRLM